MWPELSHRHVIWVLVLMVGDRTKEALISFVETLVPSAGRPHYYVRYLPTPCNWQLAMHIILNFSSSSKQQACRALENFKYSQSAEQTRLSQSMLMKHVQKACGSQMSMVEVGGLPLPILVLT